MIKINDVDVKLTVKATNKVTIKKDIEIVGIGVLPGQTEYDFSNIPEEHHELFLMAIKGQM